MSHCPSAQEFTRPSLLPQATDLVQLSKRISDLSRHAEALATACVAGELVVTSPEQRVERLRRMIRNRALRNSLFPGDLFADPAWDMMLDLTLAYLQGKTVSVSSLCIAANVPTTTALRWIYKLLESGLLFRHEDPSDGRRTLVSASEQAVALTLQVVDHS